MPAGSITLAIDSQFDNVFLVGLTMRAISTAFGMSDDGASAVELSVVEAVNNCIEHAYREDPGQRVEIVAAPDGDALRVVVRDRGRRMDWAAACARADAYAADPDAEGGRGVFIIRSLMDAAVYTSVDGVNELSLTKRLPVELPATAEVRRTATS
ncbi:MAG: ATP-binding protein [Deltaproteobacteria bacterium]|nr:ATP-binding protein [Deltaproteobacteria bacterium]